MPELHIGQLASHQERFCPFGAVNKFPYKHLYGIESEIVSQKYFATGEFRARGWSIYYIRTLLDTTDQPLLLIPQPEVEALFQDIRDAIGISVRFPDITRHPGFEIGFQEEGSPRPRYLGRFESNFSLDDLEALIPAAGMAPEQPESLEDRSFPAFRRKMELAIQAGKNKSKVAKEKKRRDRLVQKKAWCAQLRRAQCYLGLRPRGAADREDFHKDPNMTWEASQIAQANYEKAAGLRLPDLNTAEPVPYVFDKSVIFVCVDIEAYERDQKKITEIGISTLDALDILKEAPGKGGIEWIKKIRCRHFRVVENAHLHNTDFIDGCAEHFIREFGFSEWISLKEAPQIVASCFRSPFSAPGCYVPHPADARDVGNIVQARATHDEGPKRNVILVGHDIKSDIEYLRVIGYEVCNLSNLVEAIDTVDLYRAFKHEQNPRNLGSVLLELDRTGWFLHNAGNDAAYTLQALIGISLAALSPSTKPSTIPDPARLDEAARDARDRIVEETEEWEMADEEMADGGVAVKLLKPSERGYDPAFQASLRRAAKVEEEALMKRHGEKGFNRRGRGGGVARAGKNGQSTGVGEVKFHAANEAMVRRMAKHGEQKGSYKTKKNEGWPSNTQNSDPLHLSGSIKHEVEAKSIGLDSVSSVTKETVPLSEKMAQRLKIIDDGDWT